MSRRWRCWRVTVSLRVDLVREIRKMIAKIQGGAWILRAIINPARGDCRVGSGFGVERFVV